MQQIADWLKELGLSEYAERRDPKAIEDREQQQRVFW
jgi:hypothetical protein